MALVDSFILFLPWSRSVWLESLSQQLHPDFFDPREHWPLDLEYAVFFLAVTLAALHTDCLSSWALPSLIQPWNPP